MGTFKIDIEVGDPQGLRYERIEALVDTGASYLALPRSLLTRLGVVEVERRPFSLADGRTVEYPLGVVSLRMDGRAFPEKITPTNHGYSIGHWEGDTLAVESRGFNEKFWMDRGTPNTEQLRLIERFTRVDLNTMHYQATIDDPGALTRPFTTRLVAWTLDPGAELYEYVCQDHNVTRETLAGRTQQEVDYSRFFVP